MTKENKTLTALMSTLKVIINRQGGDTQIKNKVRGQEHRRNVVRLKKVEGEWQIVK